MKAFITGGTGLLGRELLANMSDAVVLSRDPVGTTRELGRGLAVKWDPATEPAPLDALKGIEVVFSLAGEPVVGGHWTPEKKRRIRDSRVLGTRNLVAGLRALEGNQRSCAFELAGHADAKYRQAEKSERAREARVWRAARL